MVLVIGIDSTGKSHPSDFFSIFTICQRNISGLIHVGHKQEQEKEKEKTETRKKETETRKGTRIRYR